MATVAIIYLTAVHGSGHSPAVPVPDGAVVSAGGHRIMLSGYQVLNHRAEAVLGLIAVIWAVRRPRTPLGLLALLTAVIYLMCTIPGVTTVFSGLVGPGQAIRYWEMLPWPYVLGPAIVLVARSRNAVLAVGVAAIASLVLERASLLSGTAATVISSLGALVLIASAVQAIARSRRRRRPSHSYNEGRGTAASVALALALAVAVLIGSISEHAHAVATAAVYGRGQPYTVDQPTPGVLHYLRSRSGPLPVVLAPFGARASNWYSGLAYELVGGAPVYAAAISGFHTESERLDQPARRRRDVAAVSPARYVARRATGDHGPLACFRRRRRPHTRVAAVGARAGQRPGAAAGLHRPAAIQPPVCSARRVASRVAATPRPS